MSAVMRPQAATPEGLVLEMSRFIRASREKVFDAFLNPEALRIWKCPAGMSSAQASTSGTVGGPWRVAMRAPDGADFIVGGIYRELARPSRLVFTWQWERGPMPQAVQTVVEVTLSERDGGTQLDLRHSGFPVAEARDAHGQGWDSTLGKLTQLTEH